LIRTSAIKIETPTGTSYYVSPKMAIKAKRRQEKRELIKLNRAPGEARGWEVTPSAGMPTWQWIVAGQHQPLT
jgi:hypothetical protein